MAAVGPAAGYIVSGDAEPQICWCWGCGRDDEAGPDELAICHRCRMPMLHRPPGDLLVRLPLIKDALELADKLTIGVGVSEISAVWEIRTALKLVDEICDVIAKRLG